MDLTGKTALVTGASRGIGKSIACEFAAAGARVALSYQKNNSAAMAVLVALDGDGHKSYAGDLRDITQVQKLVKSVIIDFGKIDILVNNAGIFRVHDFDETNLQNWQDSWLETIGTNLLAPANLTFLVAKSMMGNGGGRIINISSRGAFRGEPKAPAYGASKAGLNAFSQSMALALAKHHISVYCIAPGFVETDMAAEILNSSEGDSIRNQSPLNRVARPEEIARTALYLAADQTEFLTGCIIDVNGASYLRT